MTLHKNRKLPPWLIPAVGVLGMAVSFFMTDYETVYLAGWGKYALLGVFCLAFLALAFFLDRARKEEWKEENLFLLLFVPLSLGMMAVLPLNRAPDEQYHLLRIWQISIGQWFPTAANQGIFYEPVNLLNTWSLPNDRTTLMQLVTIADPVLDTGEYIVSNVGTNTGVYPVNNYLPQALGLALFRLFTDNRIVMLYGARLGAWTVTTVLLWYAVKKIPFGKHMIMVIALLPVNLQEAASASADGMTVAAVLAFVALFLDLRLNKRVLRKRDLAVLAVLTVSVATLKILYVPLFFLLLAIPRECYGSKKKRNLHALWMIALSVAVVVGWLLLCKLLYIDDAPASETKNGNVMPQIGFILSHPLRYLLIVAKTFVLKIPNYGGTMIGLLMSWHNVTMPVLLIGLMVLCIGGVFLCDTALPRGKNAALRHWLWWTAVGSVLIIFTSLYIWWNPYGSSIVGGVQGRYFTPLVLSVVLALRGSWSRLEKKELAFSLTALMGLLDVAMLMSLCLQVFG